MLGHEWAYYSKNVGTNYPPSRFKINTMSILNKVKESLGICNHVWVIRYDERNDLDDDKTHTFKVTLCDKCGKVKSIEELQ